MHRFFFMLALCAAAPNVEAQQASETFAPGCRFEPGAINGVLMERDGHRLAVYGWTDADANVEQVLLPHGRRDLAWKARPLIDAGSRAVAPARETFGIERPRQFWDAFTKSRYHDYAQQSTKILGEPLPIARWVKEGEAVSWQGLTFQVLETPGFTRGSVTYLVQIEDRKIAFTGDLIYGDGKLLDLYSFQDSIPEAKIRGYHGYGARLAQLVSSLQKVAAEHPDLIVPARGPMIRDPQSATASLIGRVRSVYRNYLSTSALHWYFKEARMRQCGARVLGTDADVELMPYAHHEPAPDWVFEHSTSRLILSESGHGILLDCGYQRVIDAVKELIEQGVLKQVDGIFVTHHHDDHTDRVQAAAEAFECPVYATAEYADVLEHPEAYHIPAMTANPVKEVVVKQDGESMHWHEFELTFFFFPGQTYHHGALLAAKAETRPILFVGDSFAPSGLDDYCVPNRNLLNDDAGYLRCLKLLRKMDGNYWLVNEHIPFVFSFSHEELDYLESQYRARIAMLRDLFPWDDPNYGIDEHWASFYPYGVQVPPEGRTSVELRITNHSPVPRTFIVTPSASGAIKVASKGHPLTLPPRKVGTVPIEIETGTQTGNFIITADVQSDGMDFRQWAEALVTVGP